MLVAAVEAMVEAVEVEVVMVMVMVEIVALASAGVVAVILSSP